MERIINLSELQRPTPQVNNPDLNGIVNLNDGLLDLANQRTVTDNLISGTDLSGNNLLVQQLQQREDLQNRLRIIDNEFQQQGRGLVNRQRGQGITGIGARAQQLGRTNLLKAQREEIGSTIQTLNGNISSAQALQENSVRSRLSSGSSFNSDLIADEDEGIFNEDLLAGEQDTSISVEEISEDVEQADKLYV